MHSFSGKITGKKILFLGGEGFIGRNLISYFSETNECVSVGESPSPFSGNRRYVFLKKNPYTEKIPGEYDVIVHLIDNKVPESVFPKEEKKLLRNLPLSKETRLVVFSSAVVYANPDSDYGKRKLLLEKTFFEYCKEYRISLTILRPFNLFGPFQLPYRQGSLVANLFCNFLLGKSTDINDMEAKRDFIYSRDIARFLEYALVNDRRGIFDIGSGTLTSIRELISLLERDIVKKHMDIVDRGNAESAVPRFAEGDLPKSVSLRNILEGLFETFEFYRNNKSTIQSVLEEKTSDCPLWR